MSECSCAYVLIPLTILVNNSEWFQIYGVTRCYSSLATRSYVLPENCTITVYLGPCHQLLFSSSFLTSGLTVHLVCDYLSVIKWLFVVNHCLTSGCYQDNDGLILTPLWF